MDFDEADLYACAALFTLALHETQVESQACVQEAQSRRAWGAPEEKEAENCIGEDNQSEPAEASLEWLEYWGKDLSEDGGLLDRLYKILQIPQHSWNGLKRLPEVAHASATPQGAMRHLIASYIRILDPELPQEQFQTLSNEPNSRESQYMIASRQLAAALSNFELDTDSESETDEELAQLLSKVHNPNLHTDQNLHPAELQPTDDRGQETGIVPDVKCSEATSLHLPIDCPLQEESQHQLSVNDLQSHANSIENRTARSQDARQDSSTKQRNLEEQFSDTEVYSSLCRVDPAIDDEHGSDIVQHKNVSAALQEQQISQKALTAIWSLLEAFIIDAPVTSTFPQHCAGDDGVYKEEKVSRPQPSMKRDSVDDKEHYQWYDARTRRALHLLATWTHVPWSRIVNFECLLASQLLKPEHSSSQQATNPWQRSLRIAKISAATLGLGALFAVTGGLAAPAIAAGIGSAIGLAGGSTAVATGISGFLATSTGGAIVASTVGGVGSTLVAPRISQRLGEVKEFGFWPVECSANNPSAKQTFTELSGDAIIETSAKITSSAKPVSEQTPLQQGSTESADNSIAQPKFDYTQDAGAIDEISYDCSETQAGDAGHITFAAGNREQSAPDVRLVPSGNKLQEQSTRSKSDADIPGLLHAAEMSNGQEDEAKTGWWRRTHNSTKTQLLPLPMAVNRKLEDMRPSITICVSGWIHKKEDFLTNWSSLPKTQQDQEAFSLIWESKELISLNRALATFAASQAGQQAAQWVLQHFFFTGLVAALAWPAAIYTAAQFIDTDWAVALSRAQKAGQILAHMLVRGGHGGRPVTLIGNGMGARLIFHCLLELARLRAKGIVEHACLLGMPAALRPKRWAMARSVVAGRLINGYSRNDWLLAVVYRGANGFIKTAAGFTAAPFPGVENVNLSNLVQGHFEYIEKAGEILELLGLE